MKRKRSLIVLLGVVFGLVWPGHVLADFAVPPGFDDQPVVAGVPAPTAIDWLPNGELLIATQGGVLFRWSGAGGAQPVLDLSAAVCAGGEMGLLGLAVDPAFSESGFIYLYYTRAGAGGACDSASRANRVSRFTVGAGGVGGETVLIDNIAAPGGNHNAGDLQFDANGLLYVSVGDGGSTPIKARRLDTLNGKILRIDRNGGIPAGNPFQGAGTASCAATGGTQDQAGGITAGDKTEKKRKAKKKKHKKHGKKNHKHKKHRHKKDQRKKNKGDTKNPQLQEPAPTTMCQEIFATGLRNPFRIAFDPNDIDGAQRFFINDVGGGAWEEIDVGAPAADYGWNVREGPCVIGSTTNCPQPSGFVEPIHAYQHQTGCRTITGGAFVPNSTNWPDPFGDAYLFADLACGTIFSLDTASATVATFATGSGAIHLKFGPEGALYYTTYEGGGQVRRIVP